MFTVNTFQKVMQIFSIFAKELSSANDFSLVDV